MVKKSTVSRGSTSGSRGKAVGSWGYTNEPKHQTQKIWANSAYATGCG